MKIRRMNKRFLALLSGLIMLAASTLTAMAANETVDTTKTGSLHIIKYDMTAAAEAGKTLSEANGARNIAKETDLAAYALKGVEFSYLRVADISQVTSAAGAGTASDASVKVVYTIPVELDTLLGGTKADHAYTSMELNSLLQAALTGGKKNDLEDYMTSKGGTAMGATDELGKTSAADLPLGLYLVVETKVPADVKSTTDPFFVSLPMTKAEGTEWQYDVYVYPKNQTGQPTLEKKVKRAGETTFADTTSAEIGSKVEYRVVSHLPEITTKATYLTEYTYVDILAKGLTYDKNSVSIDFYTDAALTQKVADPGLVKDTDYTVNYQDAENKMSISMTNVGLTKLNPALSQKYMAITYKASVNGDAVLGDTGNPNQVVLTYKRTGEEKKNITDGAKVYTYGINLKKNFSDSIGDATKVKFTLKEGTTTIYATSAGGVYTVCPAGAAGAATEFSPATDGTLKIKGLKKGGEPTR